MQVLDISARLVRLIKKKRELLLYTLADFIQIGVSGFLLLPYYLMVMDITSYASYSLYTTLLALFTYLVQFGLNSLYIREAINSCDKGRLMGLIITINFIAILLLVFFLIPFKYLVDSNTFSIIIVSILSAVVVFYNNFLLSILRVESDVIGYVKVQLSITALYVIFIFSFMGFSQEPLLVVMASFFVANLFVSVINYRKIISMIYFDRCYILSNIKKSLLFSSPILIGHLLYFFYQRAHVLVTSHFGTDQQVATLNLSIQLGLVIVIIAGALGKYYQPLVFRLKLPHELPRFLSISQGFKVTLGISCAVMLFVIWFLLDVIIDISEFGELKLSASIIVISNYIYYSSSIEVFAFHYIRKTHISLFNMLASVMVTLSLALIFFNVHGVPGITMAIFIGSVVYTSLNLFICRKLRFEGEEIDI